ncbi:MAG: STAS domain-containing protein [Pseudonocardiales bacterium]
MTDFSIRETSTDSECTVLALAGDLDLAGAAAMRATASSAVQDPACSTVVLDVTELTFVDSTGIGTWVELRNQADQLGKRVELRGVSQNLSRVLTIAGLLSLFGLEPGPPAPDPA